jgi:REP element-mobilizing transposase RayT
LVTTNTHARLPLFRDATLATVVLQNLEFYRERLDFSLNAFVVMPDHLHLLLIPRETWLSDIMRSLKSFSAKQIIDAVGTQGPIWQSRFHDRAIRSEDQFLAAIEYIHQNPVRAGLSSSAEQYPYSSASAYAGLAAGGAPSVTYPDGSRLGP